MKINNMRELKFRAWDSQRKNMIFDGDFWEGDNRQKGNSSICYPVSVTNKGIVWCKKLCKPDTDIVRDDEGNIGYSNWEMDKTSNRDIELMQYTGLKDKNGVEIYEGDCFGFPRVGKESEFVGTVYFDIDLGAFCVNQTNGGFQYLGKWLLDNRTCEVVGNIYENPELLKEIKTQI